MYGGSHDGLGGLAVGTTSGRLVLVGALVAEALGVAGALDVGGETPDDALADGATFEEGVAEGGVLGDAVGATELEGGGDGSRPIVRRTTPTTRSSTPRRAMIASPT